uniref:Uncharacterized protein n=1 Tax=Rhizochromulina marina TaxID=1034831 RepID=A0A7S2RW00_9STRA|mmetsp:Transcript_21775/g.63357  ORF Transcript_21775/g.63357 Transcript_21775/m.63357 type:complete len:238 (+) Transcript_21775:113-826(+)
MKVTNLRHPWLFLALLACCWSARGFLMGQLSPSWAGGASRRAAALRAGAESVLEAFRPEGCPLLAVDAGLRMGFSVFDRAGVLRAYGSHHVEEQLELKALAEQVIGAASHAAAEPIACVVCEGEESCVQPWRDAALALSERVQCAVVAPPEWRGVLLLPREASSGANAKAAARLIARQVVHVHGDHSPLAPRVTSKMNTDAAEAILIGFWASRVALALPPPHVERYTNGGVVLPPPG